MTERLRLVRDPLWPRHTIFSQGSFGEPVVHSEYIVADGEIADTLSTPRNCAGKLMAEQGSIARASVSSVQGRIPE